MTEANQNTQWLGGGTIYKINRKEIKPHRDCRSTPRKCVCQSDTERYQKSVSL